MFPPPLLPLSFPHRASLCVEQVDDCGHVPHLEKAVGTAATMASFLDPAEADP
jgi:hypothetical protein